VKWGSCYPLWLGAEKGVKQLGANLEVAEVVVVVTAAEEEEEVLK
jgi:hypothetical protein